MAITGVSAACALVVRFLARVVHRDLGVGNLAEGSRKLVELLGCGCPDPTCLCDLFESHSTLVEQPALFEMSLLSSHPVEDRIAWQARQDEDFRLTFAD